MATGFYIGAQVDTPPTNGYQYLHNRVILEPGTHVTVGSNAGREGFVSFTSSSWTIAEVDTATTTQLPYLCQFDIQ